MNEIPGQQNAVSAFRIKTGETANPNEAKMSIFPVILKISLTYPILRAIILNTGVL